MRLLAQGELGGPKPGKEAEQQQEEDMGGHIISGQVGCPGRGA